MRRAGFQTAGAAAPGLGWIAICPVCEGPVKGSVKGSEIANSLAGKELLRV